MISIPDTRVLLRTPAAMVLGAVLLGSSLTACSDSPGDTTCGEFTKMSDSERIDLIDQEVDQNGSDSDKEQWDSFTDDQKKIAADAALTGCDGEDPDTKLDDL
ncbi:hypothetical protein [Nocardioides sp.]|uniref:hypothetical protein n=1 Tax=Nocardioides sp. TaxID=35761 RepID=UPI003515F46F